MDALKNDRLTDDYFLWDIKCMKRGRPRKAASERLSKMLRHRVTTEEYRKLCRAAKRAGLSVSEYARKKLIEG